MKITLKVTISLDETAWADEYGIDAGDLTGSAVAEDVTSYVATALRSVPLFSSSVVGLTGHSDAIKGEIV